jgi:hypothetical protein
MASLQHHHHHHQLVHSLAVWLPRHEVLTLHPPHAVIGVPRREVPPQVVQVDTAVDRLA